MKKTIFILLVLSAFNFSCSSQKALTIEAQSGYDIINTMSLSLYYKTLTNNFQNYNDYKLSDIVGDKNKYVFWQSTANAEERLELDTLLTDKELEYLSKKAEEAKALKLNPIYLNQKDIIRKGKGNYTKISFPILSSNKGYAVVFFQNIHEESLAVYKKEEGIWRMFSSALISLNEPAINNKSK